MPVGKYIEIGADGKLKEIQAINQSVGAADADKIIRTDAVGKLHTTILPSGIGAETITCPASENLAANDVINLWSDAGTLKARKANATDGTKPLHGYVIDAVTSGNNAVVYLDGILPGTGYTIGSWYFLATTGGAITTTAPSGAGNVRQVAGFGISTTQVKFEPGEPIERI